MQIKLSKMRKKTHKGGDSQKSKFQEIELRKRIY